MTTKVLGGVSASRGCALVIAFPIESLCCRSTAARHVRRPVGCRFPQLGADRPHAAEVGHQRNGELVSLVFLVSCSAFTWSVRCACGPPPPVRWCAGGLPPRLSMSDLTLHARCSIFNKNCLRLVYSVPAVHHCMSRGVLAVGDATRRLLVRCACGPSPRVVRCLAVFH